MILNVLKLLLICLVSNYKNKRHCNIEFLLQTSLQYFTETYCNTLLLGKSRLVKLELESRKQKRKDMSDKVRVNTLQFSHEQKVENIQKK